MRPTLTWLLLATLLCSSSVAPLAVVAVDPNPPTPQPLAPFDYINGQLIDLDTGVKLYRLSGLKPSTGYEVRVSFPASIPASIKFTIVGPSTAAAAAGSRASLSSRQGKRLLDCEKLIFETDSQAAVQGTAEPQLELRAFRRSVHRDGPKAGAPKLVYNIVLAELLPVGLPLDSIPTVATVVVVVLVAFVWSLIWSHRLFPQLLDYLTGPTSSSSSSSKGALQSDSTLEAAAAAAAAATARTAVNRVAQGKRSR